MDKIISPVIKRLSEEIAAGNTTALEVFWCDIEKNGAPLIEHVPNDEDSVYVTVVWKDTEGIDKISVFGELFGMNTDHTQLELMQGTNLWYRCYIAPKTARSLYVFFVNEKPDMELTDIDVRLDPFHSHVITCIEDEAHPNEYCVCFKQENMIELPDFRPCPFTIPKSETPKGSVHQTEFYSELLGRSKRIWIYKPANYEPLDKPCNLTVFMDGWEYVHETKMPVVLDNMIAEGVIPPTIGVFIDNRTNRIEDLRLNQTFIDFLAKEIMPWIRGLYNISHSPKDILVGGFSASGLAAGYAAFLYPTVFGKVLSQSGAFYWGFNEDMTGEVLVELYAKSEKLPVDIFMSLGEFEKFDYHLDAHTKLRKILKEKGYRVMYQEFMGGHTNFDCQLTLSQGLQFLFGQ